MKTPKLFCGTVLVLGFLLASGPVFAAGAAKYPAYAHALADLRAAKSLLEKGGVTESAGEKKALREINLTIDDLRKATLDGSSAPEAPDATVQKANRLGSALHLLAKAEKDIRVQKGEPSVGFKSRTEQHLKKAYRLVEELKHSK